MGPRKLFKIAGLAGLSISMFSMAAYTFFQARTPRKLGGPVAIVIGDPPKHGFLGVDFGEAVHAPLVVQKVTKGSGAAHAGMQKGDVIVSAGQMKDPDLAALQRLTQSRAPGDELSLRITRGRATMDLRVKMISFADMVVLRQRERSREAGT